jgi:predicted nicotinamide N-methyase
MASYRTAQAVVSVGGIEYRMRTLSDRQQFDDTDGAAAQAGICSASWSLFGQLWPAGWGLAQAMAIHPVAGLRILEVGCGLALASLVLARRGADITASDHHPLAERFLRANARANALRMPIYHRLPWAGADPALGRFNLIIGADLLYERDHAGLLAGLVSRHAAPRALVLLADPGRGNCARLAHALAHLGFASSRQAMAVDPTGIPPHRGRLLHFHRGGTSAERDDGGLGGDVREPRVDA